MKSGHLRAHVASFGKESVAPGSVIKILISLLFTAAGIKLIAQLWA